MKKLVIGCDMDGILADCTPWWLENIFLDHGIMMDVAQIDQWSLHKCGALQDLGAEKVYAYLQKPGFFRNMPPIPEAVEALHRIARNHNVFIISSPSGPVSAKEKYEWLAEYCPEIKLPNICLFPTKTMVQLDVLIDDHPQTVVDYHAKWPDSLVLGVRYPYNRDVPTLPRLKMCGHYWDPAVAWEQIEAEIQARADE